MPDFDDIDLSAGFVDQPRRPRSRLTDLISFAREHKLTVGSTTGGRHNRGSKHYSGNAIDIRGSGGFDDATVQRLKQAAAERGLLLRDERRKPPRQKVWGGPHVHIEAADLDLSAGFQGQVSPVDTANTASNTAIPTATDPPSPVPDEIDLSAGYVQQSQESQQQPTRRRSSFAGVQAGVSGQQQSDPFALLKSINAQPAPRRRQSLGQAVTALPGGHQILNLLPEEERENFAEGVTGAVAGTARQLANTQELGMRATPIGYVGRKLLNQVGIEPRRMPEAIRDAGQSLESAVAENVEQRPEPTTFAGEVRRGVGRGVGAASVELPKLIVGGRLLGAANLSVQGALSRADEGVPGIVKGAAGGLVYHYGGQVTGKFLGQVGNSLVWIAGPTAERMITDPNAKLGETIGENVPFGIFAGAGGAARRRRQGRQTVPDAVQEQLRRAEQVQVRDGETVRAATDADLTRILKREVEVVPPERIEDVDLLQSQTRQQDRADNVQQVQSTGGIGEAGRGREAGTPQRFQHLQFGEIEVTADQSGARPGRIKVSEVADPTKQHYVRKADMQGRGNARMIPIKSESDPAGRPFTTPAEVHSYLRALPDAEFSRYAKAYNSISPPPEGQAWVDFVNQHTGRAIPTTEKSLRSEPKELQPETPSADDPLVTVYRGGELIPGKPQDYTTTREKAEKYAWNGVVSEIRVPKSVLDKYRVSDFRHDDYYLITPPKGEVKLSKGGTQIASDKVVSEAKTQTPVVSSTEGGAGGDIPLQGTKPAPTPESRQIAVGDEIKLNPTSAKVGGGELRHPKQTVQVEAIDDADNGGQLLRFRYKTRSGQEKIGYANTITESIETVYRVNDAAEQRVREQAAADEIVKQIERERIPSPPPASESRRERRLQRNEEVRQANKQKLAENVLRERRPLTTQVMSPKGKAELSPSSAVREVDWERVKMDFGRGYNEMDYRADRWSIGRIKQSEFPSESDVQPKLDILKRQIQSGEVRPILVSGETGSVINGNNRLKAYQQLGIKDVPVLVVTGEGTGKIEFAQRRLEDDVYEAFKDRGWIIPQSESDVAKMEGARLGEFEEKKLQRRPMIPPSTQGEVRKVGVGKETIGLSREAVPADRSATSVKNAATAELRRERSLPKSLEAAGLPGGRKRFYDVKSTIESEAAARRIIKERGVDEAANWVQSGERPSAEQSATAIELIRGLAREAEMETTSDAKVAKLTQAAELSSIMSVRATEAGQAISYFATLAKESPEGAIYYAERAAKRRNGQGLTPELRTEIFDVATRLKTVETRLEELQQKLQRPSRAAPRSQITTRIRQWADQAEVDARARLAARAGVPKDPQAGASTIPLDIADYSIIGAAKLARGTVEFAEWSKQMVAEFGDDVRPHLRQIRTESQKLLDEQSRIARSAKTVDEITRLGESNRAESRVIETAKSIAEGKSRTELNQQLRADHSLTPEQADSVIARARQLYGGASRERRQTGKERAALKQEPDAPPELRKELVAERDKLLAERGKERRELMNMQRRLEQGGPSWGQRGNNIFRGLIVSAMQTASRNLVTQTMRGGVESLTDAFEVAIVRAGTRKGGKPKEGDIDPKISYLDTLKSSAYLFQRNKRVVNGILDEFPVEHEQMFRRFSSDVELAPQSKTAQGMDKALGRIERAVEIVNTFNRFQEFIGRRAVFRGVLEARLRARGIDLNKIVGEGRQSEIPREDIQAAVESAMRVTFAETPARGTKAESFVHFTSSLPAPINPLTFSRFLWNSAKFVVEYQPTTALRGAYRTAKDQPGAARDYAKAAVGTVMLTTAVQIYDQMHKEESEWYLLVNPLTGNEFDIRPYQPFASYVFAAHFLRSKQKGEQISYEPNRMGRLGTYVEGVAGFQARPNVAYEAGKRAVSEDWEGALTQIKRMGGETVAAALTPLKTPKQIIAQFDKEEATMRNTRERPFVDPILNAIPMMGQGLEPVTRKEKVAVQPNPILQPLGIREIDPNTKYTRAENLMRSVIQSKLGEDKRTEVEIAESKNKSQLRARSRQGEDVSAEMDKLELTDRERKTIESARSQTRLQEDFKRLSVEDAILVYGVMTRGERESTRELLQGKAERVMGNRTDSEQAKLKDDLSKLGIALQVRRNSRPSRRVRQSRAVQ